MHSRIYLAVWNWFFNWEPVPKAVLSKQIKFQPNKEFIKWKIKLFRIVQVQNHLNRFLKILMKIAMTVVLGWEQIKYLLTVLSENKEFNRFATYLKKKLVLV